LGRIEPIPEPSGQSATLLPDVASS
jgi:hypothetical protein